MATVISDEEDGASVFCAKEIQSAVVQIRDESAIVDSVWESCICQMISHGGSFALGKDIFESTGTG